MSGLASDLRYALRSLRKSPGYSLLCVVALALGIGANGAIFSLVDALMLRPLPYPHPEQLTLAYLVPGGAVRALGPERTPWSYPKVQTLVATQRAFSEIAAFVSDSVNLTGAGEPERLQMEMVSPSYFHLLGVRAAAGRTFVAADGKAGDPVVAVVGEGLWRRRFGADPGLVGRTLHLGKVRVTVVGVVSGRFRGLTGEAEIWVPVTAAAELWYPQALTEVGNHYLEVVGRLHPGVTPGRLAAEMERVGAVVQRANPMPPEIDDGTVWGARAVSLAEARRDPTVRRALVVALAAVGAVLLIACANLAALALARAAGRRRDFAIRRAVGASGARLVRQALFESVLLALAGAAAGLVPAAWIVRGLAAIRPESLGTWGVGSAELYDLATAGLDLRVVLFCAVVAVATAVLFGIAPALATRRLQLASDLRAGGASVAGRAGHSGLHRAGASRGLLVAGQMALAMVLLVGAGLLVRSLWALQHVALGFEPDGVLTFALAPPSGAYDDSTAGPFHESLLERLRGLPGVETVALGGCPPASGEAGCNSTVLTSIDGRQVPPAPLIRLGWHKVSGDYFRALGVPVRAGRTFDAHDRDGAPRVVILNETAARRLFPGGDAVGHRLQMGTMGLSGDVHAEVIGVVDDVRYHRLEDEPTAEAYLPDAQVTLARTTVFVRSSGDPLALVPAVRAAVQGVDRELPIYRVRTLDEQLGFALSKARFGSLLLAVFALMALGLAAVGVYGILAQTVSARWREIGLRMALGAAGGEVERLVLRQGMAVALAGALAGVALALPATAALRSLLYGVPARDPWTLAGVTVLLLLVALIACVGPARRAARLDPARLLRQE